MSSQRKVYTRDFKQEAMRLAETSPKPTVEIEADLGLPPGLLNKWKRQLAEEGQAFRGQGRAKALPGQRDYLHYKPA